MAILLILGDDGAVVRTHGIRQRTTTLGRGLANSVPLPDDPAVSSFHAQIQRTPNGYEIQDQSSRNGTWVNGEPVATRSLHDGDQIQIGATLLQFALHRPTAKATSSPERGPGELNRDTSAPPAMSNP